VEGLQFNRPEKVRSYEGGRAYKLPPEETLFKLVGARLLGEETFYEPGCASVRQIEDLSQKVSPQFMSKLALVSRKVFRLRSSPLFLAYLLAARCAGTEDVKLAEETLVQVLDRPDFLGEIIAMHWAKGKRPLPAVIKRALRKAFTNFDEYQLAKYCRQRNRKIRLRDVMFLVHPAPPSGMEEIYRKLANDKLEPPMTRESLLAAAKSDEERRAAYVTLMRENRFPALSFLMALRAMYKVNVPREMVIDYADRISTKHLLPSKVLAAYLVALNELKDRELARVLDRKFVDIVKRLAEKLRVLGKVAVIIDQSASMDWSYSSRSVITPAMHAAMLGLALYHATGADVYVFSNDVVKVEGLNPEPTMADVETVMNAVEHSGTYLGKAIRHALNNRAYDTLLVLTDEQLHDRVPKLPPNTKGIVFAAVGYRNSAVRLGSKWEMVPALHDRALDYAALSRWSDKTSPEEVLDALLEEPRALVLA